MPANSTDDNNNGFFAKLKARLNRGTTWLSTELRGLGAQPLDENVIEELETRLLTADVGVDAASWLIDEMRTANKRKPDTPAIELLRETAAALLRTIESPLAVAGAPLRQNGPSRFAVPPGSLCIRQTSAERPSEPAPSITSM